MNDITENKFFLILAFLLLFLNSTAFPAEQSTSDILVNIKQGSSGSEITTQLNEKGIIKSPRLFYLLLKISGSSRDLKSGSYRLRPNMNYFKLISELKKGSNLFIKITIPEGFTTEQIAKRLYSAGIIKSESEFIDEVISKDIRGYLFPETYNFDTQVSIEEVIKIMTDEFDKRFLPEYRARAEEIGFSVKDVVTLASLIEKEARVPEERPIISDIFHKRLKKRIYLESCASVLFALGVHKKRLLYEDLEVESPYNTYRHFGLPPTPICNPGMDSIIAALYPARTKYLYFFAKGKDGSHIFSSTYEEHLLLQRRQKAFKKK